MRFIAVQINDNTATYFRVQDTGQDVDAIVFVGPVYGTSDEAQAAANALNG